MSKAPDPLCSKKVWRKITLVKCEENYGKFKGNLRKKSESQGNLRKIKEILRNIKGHLRKIMGNFLEQKGSGASDNQDLI